MDRMIAVLNPQSEEAQVEDVMIEVRSSQDLKHLWKGDPEGGDFADFLLRNEVRLYSQFDRRQAIKDAERRLGPIKRGPALEGFVAEREELTNDEQFDLILKAFQQARQAFIADMKRAGKEKDQTWREDLADWTDTVDALRKRDFVTAHRRWRNMDTVIRDYLDRGVNGDQTTMRALKNLLDIEYFALKDSVRTDIEAMVSKMSRQTPGKSALNAVAKLLTEKKFDKAAKLYRSLPDDMQRCFPDSIKRIL